MFWALQKKKCSGGTQLGEEPTSITNIDEIHSKSDCVFGSTVNERRQSILFLSALVLHLVSKNSKSPHQICLRK